jgi:hypothetical protein
MVKAKLSIDDVDEYLYATSVHEQWRKSRQVREDR